MELRPQKKATLLLLVAVWTRVSAKHADLWGVSVQQGVNWRALQNICLFVWGFSWQNIRGPHTVSLHWEARGVEPTSHVGWMLVCWWASDHWLGNKGRTMGASKGQTLVSHPHSSSWRLSSLLWSVWTPFDPPIETRDEKVAMETKGNDITDQRSRLDLPCEGWSSPSSDRISKTWQ